MIDVPHGRRLKMKNKDMNLKITIHTSDDYTGVEFDTEKEKAIQYAIAWLTKLLPKKNNVKTKHFKSKRKAG